MKKILPKIKELLAFCGLICFPIITLAQTGLGKDADQLVHGPIEHFKNFMSGACYLVGILLLFNGFNKYQEYRRNAQDVPLSVPIFYTVLGILIILLPLSRYLVTMSGT